MKSIDPTRLRRSQKQATKQLAIAWGFALAFLLLVLVGLLIAKLGA